MILWKRMEERSRGLILRYYSGIRLEELRKNTKSLSQDSRSPVQYLNSGPPEYETGVLTTTFGKSGEVYPIETYCTFQLQEWLSQYIA
jgi:hypothetical protein